MNNSLVSILDTIKNSKTVVILGHTNPDGDAVNAAFALAFAIEKLNIKPIVLLENYNSKYDVSDGKKFVFNGDISKLKFDLIISVDTASLDRLGIARDLFIDAPLSICIDHHISNTYFAKLNYVITEASSTCEIIYDISLNLVEMCPNIASCIYAGIIYDTAGFKHLSTTSKTLSIASNLLDIGIPFNDIYYQLMSLKSILEVKVFSRAISRIQLEHSNKISYSYLTLNDFKELNATSQDLDNIAGYLISIEGVKVSIFAYERENNEVKVSFRSKVLDVSEICKTFGGGGHKLAAGCTIKGSIKEVLSQVIDVVENEMDKYGC